MERITAALLDTDFNRLQGSSPKQFYWDADTRIENTY